MGIRDLALLASRTVLGGYLGGYLAAHGAQKLFGTFGGHGIEPTAAAFHRLGLRPGRVTATAAGAVAGAAANVVLLRAAPPEPAPAAPAPTTAEAGTAGADAS
jgi:putative oxidoreductase